MKRPKVYVTRELPLEALELLKEKCDVYMNVNPKALTKDDFIAIAKNYDAIIVTGVKIDEEICEGIKERCKILASYGVGYDNIDIDAATRCGIYVTNNPDKVTNATADLAWALLLGVARRIGECDSYVRDGNKDWGPNKFMGSQVSGKTIGIIGAGRIGTAVAKRAKGFDMRIIYNNSKPNEDFERATGGAFMDMESLLKNSDFISIHTPLQPSTYHLISSNELRLMKKSTILINTARGQIVDEKALVTALKNGEIAGAGLDVFEKEPAVEQELLHLKNVLLTPHIGTSTMDARILMGEGCAINMFSVFEGKVPPNCINPEVQPQNNISL